MIPLPEGAFKESNTSVRTRLAVPEKWDTESEEAMEEKPTAALELSGMGAKDKRIPWRQLKMF